MAKDIEFNSAIELYNRVKPALKVKYKEIHKDYDYIKLADIWNYLIQYKWRNAKDLVLSDVVDDILNIENKKIDEYVKKDIKDQEKEIIEEELDII